MKQINMILCLLYFIIFIFLLIRYKKCSRQNIKEAFSINQMPEISNTSVSVGCDGSHGNTDHRHRHGVCCGKGEKFNVSTRICEGCPSKTYQNKTFHGDTACKSCDGTDKVYKVSTDKSQCYTCPNGYAHKDDDITICRESHDTFNARRNVELHHAVKKCQIKDNEKNTTITFYDRTHTEGSPFYTTWKIDDFETHEQITNDQTRDRSLRTLIPNKIQDGTIDATCNFRFYFVM